MATKSWNPSEFLPKPLLRDLATTGTRIRVTGLRPSALALFIHTIHLMREGPIWVVTRSLAEARTLYRDIVFFRDKFEAPQLPELAESAAPKGPGTATDPIILPAPAFEPYQYYRPTHEVSKERVTAAYRISTERSPLVLTSYDNLLCRQESLSFINHQVVTVEMGGTLARDNMMRRLLESGYERVLQVQNPGELSVRGGILDVYGPGFPYAVRIELVDERVASLRAVDPTTQRAVNRLERAVFLPLAGTAITAENMKLLLGEVADEAEWRSFSPLRRIRILDDLRNGDDESVARYFYQFLATQAQATEWISPNALVILNEDDELTMLQDHYRKKAIEEFGLLTSTTLVRNPDKLYLDRATLMKELAPRTIIVHRFFDSFKEQENHYSFTTKHIRGFGGDLEALTRQVEDWLGEGLQVNLVARSSHTATKLRKTVSDHNVEHILLDAAYQAEGAGRLVFLTGDPTEGFQWPEMGLVLLNEREMLGQKIKRQLESKAEPDYIGLSFQDLTQGDFLVHFDHGIGKYLGLKRLLVEGVPQDFVEILYADDNKLYLPMDQLHLIQKYLGGGDYHPGLDRLGSTKWLKTRTKIKESILLLAADLLQLYARREVASGHAFTKDHPLQREFELQFEYEETDDQIKAIDEVKRDMERPKPMDRLICGDVGYGKTEVAMRAAFKAVLDHKQVAVLTPTTILSQQHYDTFRKRFSQFPVEIAMLSRFVNDSETKKVITAVKEGKIDILIGTHKLLSNQVSFKDLGLIVIDEEHRFGVRDKEKLKQLRASTDILTLTATPIPRTLHLSLITIRDMTVIHTPPEERLPIKTKIIKFDQTVIKRVIRDELERGGQVYFVHNRVQSIDSIAELVRKLVPEARVIVGHGQMKEKDLSRVMHEFAAHEYDVLVATTIIESGLDIPNVNTILINRADMFGLAQLYQLRGRVGRDRYQAHAYLFIPGFNLITPDARKRLEALTDAKELGAGFKLALADLEIRGAGDVLGARQHGQIAAIGFELYTQLLREAVAQVRGDVIEEQFDPTVNLRGEALIPDSYIPEGGQRLYFYRQLAIAARDSGLQLIQEELEDRYGALPEAVRLLLLHRAIKQLARRLRIRKIDHKADKFLIVFDEQTGVDASRLSILFKKYPRKLTMLSPAKLEVKIYDEPPMKSCQWLRDFLILLNPATS